MASITRAKLTRKERAVVLERTDGRCTKCYIRPIDEVHHIQAVADGGGNADDNLIGLCNICHREWHLLMEDFDPIGFVDWCNLPPAPLLIAALIASDTATQTQSVSAFLDSIRSGMVNELMRQLKH